MTNSLAVNIAVEGDLDEVVLKKVLTHVGIKVGNVYGKRGKDYLRENVPRYNQAARYGSWVVLVDLNNDAVCPPPLVTSWLPNRNQGIQLRVAVHAVEAWLIADRRAISHFLRVSQQRIPLQPENETRPKATLINVAKHSNSRAIREDIVPSPTSMSSQGPGYTSRMIEFTVRYWDPNQAANCAPSLNRSINSLSRWKSAMNPPE